MIISDDCDATTWSIALGASIMYDLRVVVYAPRGHL
jgi:hypothetical protein